MAVQNFRYDSKYTSSPSSQKHFISFTKEFLKSVLGSVCLFRLEVCSRRWKYGIFNITILVDDSLIIAILFTETLSLPLNVFKGSGGLEDFDSTSEWMIALLTCRDICGGSAWLQALTPLVQKVQMMEICGVNI